MTQTGGCSRLRNASRSVKHNKAVDNPLTESVRLRVVRRRCFTSEPRASGPVSRA